jgi:UDP-GlcNAc:undecaprenyl-phosphate GlcNAc-1-phosphate transferase
LGLLILIKPELFLDQGQHILLSANFFLAGLCFGSWWLYFQGKILLGDSGSQTLGFLLAIMAIFSGAKIATTLLFLLLPLVDVAFSIWRRWKAGGNIFHGDTNHLHHLLKRKINEKTAVTSLLLLSFCFGLIAILGGKILKLGTLFVAIIMIWLIINWLYSKEK